MSWIRFFRTAYWKLMVGGFSGWQANSIFDNRVPISTAKSIGPQRLSRLEDVLAIAESTRDHGESDIFNLEEIARARPRFTASELAGLASAEHSDIRRSKTYRIGLADVEGYEAARIAKPEDMLNAFSRGLIYGEEIPGLLSLGIHSIDDMTFVQLHGLSPSSVREYVTEKITDIKDMVKLYAMRVWGRKIPTYKLLGTETVEQIVAMASAGIVGTFVSGLPKEFENLGINNPEQRKDLLMAGIFPEDVQRYQTAGVNEQTDMIHLMRLGVTSELAVNFAKSGLSGDVTGMAASAMQSQLGGTR